MQETKRIEEMPNEKDKMTKTKARNDKNNKKIKMTK